MNTKRFFWIVVLTLTGAFVVAACNLAPSDPPGAQAEHAGETEHSDEPAAEAGHDHEPAAEAGHDHGHAGDTHSPDQHMAGMHGVPEEAAAVPNPFEANAASMETGGQLYAASCAVCHGETGQGDGPGAAGLEKPPANLNEGHVQELSDGSLFYIISHGKPETPMPAWENILDEEQRWHVVNFLRTFGD